MTVNQGWQCPCCHTVYNPAVVHCLCQTEQYEPSRTVPQPNKVSKEIESLRRDLHVRKSYPPGGHSQQGLETFPFTTNGGTTG